MFQKIAAFTLSYVLLRFADVGMCIRIFVETFPSLWISALFFASYLGLPEQNTGVY